MLGNEFHNGLISVEEEARINRQNKIHRGRYKINPADKKKITAISLPQCILARVNALSEDLRQSRSAVITNLLTLAFTHYSMFVNVETDTKIATKANKNYQCGLCQFPITRGELKITTIDGRRQKTDIHAWHLTMEKKKKN